MEEDAIYEKFIKSENPNDFRYSRVYLSLGAEIADRIYGVIIPYTDYESLNGSQRSEFMRKGEEIPRSLYILVASILALAFVSIGFLYSNLDDLYIYIIIINLLIYCLVYLCIRVDILHSAIYHPYGWMRERHTRNLERYYSSDLTYIAYNVIFRRPRSSYIMKELLRSSKKRFIISCIITVAAGTLVLYLKGEIAVTEEEHSWLDSVIGLFLICNASSIYLYYSYICNKAATIAIKYFDIDVRLYGKLHSLSMLLDAEMYLQSSEKLTNKERIYLEQYIDDISPSLQSEIKDKIRYIQKDGNSYDAQYLPYLQNLLCATSPTSSR